MKKEVDFESKFFYRLIKVAYMLALIIAVLGSIAFGIEQIPTKVLDYDNSTLNCVDGKKYSLIYTDIVFAGIKDKEDSFDAREAGDYCLKFHTYRIRNNTTNEEKDVDYAQMLAYNLDPIYAKDGTNLRSHTYTLVEKTEGNWTEVIKILALGTGISYAVLNLIKETLFYVFLGKKFSWKWFFSK